MKKVLILCLGLFLLGCQEEKEEEVVPQVPEVTWKEDTRFTLETRAQTNSFASRSNLYLLGLNTLSRISAEKGRDTLSRSMLESVRNPTQYRYPLTEKLVAVGYQESNVLVYPTHYPSLQSGRSLQMLQLDPEFQAFDFIPARQGECMKISDNHVLAVPYRANNGMKVLLATLEVTPSTTNLYDVVKVTRTQIVTISPLIVPFQYVGLHGNGFYIANGEGTYLLSEDGQLTTVRTAGLNAHFTYNQTMYGLFNDGLHQSPDGKTWSYKANISTLNQLSYTSLHDTLLIGTFNDQIFQLRLKPSSINMLELKNEGLKGHKITSVALFNQKVYITTLSGVFVKDEKDFLSYRETRKEY